MRILFAWVKFVNCQSFLFFNSLLILLRVRERGWLTDTLNIINNQLSSVCQPIFFIYVAVERHESLSVLCFKLINQQWRRTQMQSRFDHYVCSVKPDTSCFHIKHMKQLLFCFGTFVFLPSFHLHPSLLVKRSDFSALKN